MDMKEDFLRLLDNGEQIVTANIYTGTRLNSSLSLVLKFGRNNWVVDFGGLKDLESWLRRNFDHKTLVASDDPKLTEFKTLDDSGIIDMVVVESTGAEMFAKMAMEYSSKLIQETYGKRCWVESVTVREHGANSAKCKRS